MPIKKLEATRSGHWSDRYWNGFFDGVANFFKGNPTSNRNPEPKSLTFAGSHSLPNSEPLFKVDPIEWLKGLNDSWKGQRLRESMTGETKIGNPTSHNPNHLEPLKEKGDPLWRASVYREDLLPSQTTPEKRQYATGRNREERIVERGTWIFLK